jgi:hypothetical protein
LSSSDCSEVRKNPEELFFYDAEFRTKLCGNVRFAVGIE